LEQRAMPMGPHFHFLTLTVLVGCMTCRAQMTFEVGAPSKARYPNDDMMHPSNQWHYIDETGKDKGPVGLEELRGMFYEDQLLGSSKVWLPGMETWEEIDKVTRLREYMSAQRATDPRSKLLFDADGFVSKMNTFESTIKETGTGGKGSDLFCAKKAALNMLLSKSALKEMLKDVLVEVKTSEEDKKKLKARLAELRRNATEIEVSFKNDLEETDAGLKLMKQNFDAYKTAYEKVRDYKPKYKVLQTYRDIFRASMSLNSNLMKIYVIQPVKKIGGLYFTLGVVVLLLLASRLRSSKSDPDTE